MKFTTSERPLVAPHEGGGAVDLEHEGARDAQLRVHVVEARARCAVRLLAQAAPLRVRVRVRVRVRERVRVRVRVGVRVRVRVRVISRGSSP